MLCEYGSMENGGEHAVHGQHRSNDAYGSSGAGMPSSHATCGTCQPIEEGNLFDAGKRGEKSMQAMRNHECQASLHAEHANQILGNQLVSGGTETFPHFKYRTDEMLFLSCQVCGLDHFGWNCVITSRGCPPGCRGSILMLRRGCTTTGSGISILMLGDLFQAIRSGYWAAIIYINMRLTRPPGLTL